MCGGRRCSAATWPPRPGPRSARASRACAGSGSRSDGPWPPMLAGTAADVDAALERISPAAVEWKLDGARIQVHRRNGEVRVFTRSLDDVTESVPEVVEAALGLRVESAVLDGEAIALREDGRPHPFQVTASRFASRRDVDAQRSSVPLTAALLRRPSRGRRRPPRPPRRRALRGARVARPRADARAADGRGHRRRRRRRPRGRARARARGRDGEGAGRAVRGRRPRRRMAQGEAAPHPRSGRAGSGVGPRTPHVGGCRTCTSAPATRTAASACSARRSRG